MIRIMPTMNDTQPRLINVQRIWDQAPHNAFTDLTRFNDRWLVSFREGEGHASDDGQVRIIASDDGAKWSTIALFQLPGMDVREAKLSCLPDGRLMALGAWRRGPIGEAMFQSVAWYSSDGQTWSDAQEVGQVDMWLWRAQLHDDQLYSIGYACDPRHGCARLYRSVDGEQYDVLVESMFDDEFPSESGLAFDPDGRAVVLIRGGRRDQYSRVGTAIAPYTDWNWHKIDRGIGGPALVRLPDGRYIAGCRIYDDRPERMSLCWVDPEAGNWSECLMLPSAGDCSYPGMVWHEDKLWVSYYSTHEGKTSIYLATIAID